MTEWISREECSVWLSRKLKLYSSGLSHPGSRHRSKIWKNPFVRQVVSGFIVASDLSCKHSTGRIFMAVELANFKTNCHAGSMRRLVWPTHVLAPYIAEINLKPDNVFVCFLLAYLSIHVFESLRKSHGNLKWRFSDYKPVSFGVNASGNRRKRKEVDF